MRMYLGEGIYAESTGNDLIISFRNYGEPIIIQLGPSTFRNFVVFMSLIHQGIGVDGSIEQK